MITNNTLERDYHTINALIEKAIAKNDYEQALSFVELSAHLQYQYNFRSSYYDAFLEHSMSTIASRLFDQELVQGKDEKILFFDYFAYDNRGLTQQYLRALIQLGKKVIFVYEHNNRYYGNIQIQKELNEYENAQVYYLEGTTRVEKAQQLMGIVKQEQPGHIFMHISPWDTIPFLVFDRIKGIKRYQINLTDHAFWLGRGITDINLEFRSYGCNISTQYRNIPVEKSAILPYYPILSPEPFQGFDFDVKDKKIIFSGSAIYKVLGDNLEFFELVKELLSVDEQLIFVFAGSGNKEPILQFARKHHFEDRLFLIGDRTDIFEVVKKIDYFLCTFPFTGALMTQLAVINQIPSFSYVKQDYLFNDVSDLFLKKNTLYQFNNIPELVEAFKEIYFNADKKTVEENSNNTITPQEFADNLDAILKGQNPLKHTLRKFDVSEAVKVVNRYLLESENKYNPLYSQILHRFLSEQQIRTDFPRYWNYYMKQLFKENKREYVKKLLKQLFKKG